MLQRLICSMLVVLGCIQSANANFTLETLTSFGGGDGWLAPAETPGFLGTTNLQRGLAYNQTNNELYLVDRNAGSFVRVLDGSSGALLRTLDTTGVTGGTFASNMIGVGGDGSIYMGNLSTSAAESFKLYRWADSSAGVAPTVAFNASTNLGRTGDSFAVIGSGASTRIVASGSGHAGVALLSTTNGTDFTLASSNTIAGVASGGFRLGLDFIDPNTVVGKQTGTAIYTGNLSTSIGTASVVTSAGEAALAYDAGNRLLATVEFNSNLVRLYDATDFSNLNLLSSLNTTTAFTANGNGTGDLAFGLFNGEIRLYAMNTNNGIQAFRVTAIPEPSSTTLLAAGGALLLGVARRRRK
jgi:hypothetical protein